MYVKVRATTGAKKETVRVVSVDTLAISVKEKAERNMANARITDLVAAHYGVPSKKIRMIKGHRSPSKTFSVDAV
ncbi:DUF167 domain-containing protein [Candidatus Kaiserbacteria bacterium]|nr:DUF167 domain-containing protein [Candidatus Kaiserbacteria bacterium]